jgi:hypothetical protein
MVLLSAGHLDVEGLGDLRRPLKLLVRTRLLELREAVPFEKSPDLDRLLRPVARVRVGQQLHVVSERLASHQPESAS